MPPPKKAAIASPSLDKEEVVVVRSTRAMRKRKQVNYAEPGELDPDWVTDTPKNKVKASRNRGTVEDEEVIVVDDAPAQRRKTNAAKMGSVAGTQDDPLVLDEESTAADEVIPAPKKQTTQIRSKTKAPNKRRKVRDDEVEYDNDGVEIRKRDFQEMPSENFNKKLNRAITHPILFVDRRRCDKEDYPVEEFTIAGSTGDKRYTVLMGLVPKCSCPDGIFGRTRGPCKHILYTLVKVLKVPMDSPLLHQHAFTSDELRAIFEQAPEVPFIDLTGEDYQQETNRKPVEGECPICYMEFEPGKEAISYCKAHCGNNVHRDCMVQWLRSQQQMYGKGTCPYCRMNWVN